MKCLLSWSSGKDSAWALHVLRQRPDVEVVGLFTTLNERFDRVAMHGVRRTLLEAQSAAASLQLHVLPIPHPCPNEVYARIMGDFVSSQASAGIEAFAFGDLFLEDIRHYRETMMSGTGIAPIFPLWGLDTHQLARDMIAGGLTAHLVCIDPRKLERSLAGHAFDTALLSRLPLSVDPCGENGEFHTCVSAGPMFSSPISITLGETVEREGFVFRDLLTRS